MQLETRPTVEVTYVLPFDCSEGSSYQAKCKRLPQSLLDDVGYSDPDAAQKRNVYVFLGLNKEELGRMGTAKPDGKSVFLILGRFECTRSSTARDKTSLILRPLPPRRTHRLLPPRSPRDLAVVAALVALSTDGGPRVESPASESASDQD